MQPVQTAVLIKIELLSVPSDVRRVTEKRGRVDKP